MKLSQVIRFMEDYLATHGDVEIWQEVDDGRSTFPDALPKKLVTKRASPSWNKNGKSFHILLG